MGLQRRDQKMDGPVTMNFEWQDKGLCRKVDPEIFFVDPGQNATEAKAICARCPVQPECLITAIQTRERYGVFGGLTSKEREELIRGTQKTIRQCINCGTKFMPVNRNQRNCSAKCRKERERELDKANRLTRRSKGTFKHGRSGYQLGCHCDICITGEHEYSRNYRAQRKERKAG